MGDAGVVVEIDDIRYDGRALSRPPGRGRLWSGWTGRVRRAFAAFGGAVESRSITSVPWAVGDTLSPASASQERALRMGPVFSAVRLIVDHVSTLPVKAYRKAGSKRIPRSGLPDLFWRLDEDGQLIPWLKRCVTSLMLRGNAYGLVTSRDDLGFPLVIQWLDPSDVSCNDTNPWAPIWYWMGREIPREDLLHIPWFVVAGKVQGLSPIEVFAITTNTGLKAQEYGTTWFDNGGVPPGTFKNSKKEVPQTAADAVSDRLVTAIRSRRPIVYGADWDYNPISIPPEQAQFIETLKMTATQIAAIYGLPPEMIGGSTGDPMTYKTEEQFQARLNSALRPLLVLLESAFSSILPRFEQVKLNADATARADLKTRYESYEIALRIGLLSGDEIRALEDLPPLPAGQRPALVSPGQQQPTQSRKFDPRQPRDDEGQWSKGAGAVVGAAADAVSKFPGMRPASDEDRAVFRERTGKAIPPAWTDVHIADDLDTAKILVRGRDGKGRGQTIYSAAHTEGQAAAKFARITQLMRHLDKLDHAVERDADTDDDAAALLLIRKLGMRPGSERNTGAEKHAHGATNLRAKHVSVEDGRVDFDFTGKKGVRIQLSTDDPAVVSAISRRLESRSGDDRLFDTSEDRTRAYMRSTGVPSGFLLKDLRTVRANVVALREIAGRDGMPTSKSEFRRWRKEVATAVSKQLGNTPTLALASYINPTVFGAWEPQEDWL